MGQINIEEDGFLSLMDDSGDTREDVKLPDGEVGDRIKKMLDEGKDVSKYHACTSLPGQRLTVPDVIVLKAMGEEVAIDCKEGAK